MKRKLLTFSLAIFVGGGIFTLTQCKKKNNSDPASGLLTQAKTFFQPIAKVTNADNPITDAKVALGKQLYFDVRLSKNKDISCNSCHPLSASTGIPGGGFGMDNVQFSNGTGTNNINKPRNTPTTIASSLLAVQFWDGRALTVEQQAIGPIISGTEMGMDNRDSVVNRLQAIPGYVTAFNNVFGENGLTYENIGNAIGAFERDQLMPETSFDRFLKGDLTALSAAQQAGLREFMAQKCTDCHLGAALADDVVKFQVFGKQNKEYWTFTGTQASLFVKNDGTTFFENNDSYDKGVGRAHADNNAFPDKGNATAHPELDYFFKIPGLRNVEKTAPYFHDGSVADLGEAVKLMAKAQFGTDLTQTQTDNIVAFLSSLTASVDITAPAQLD